MKQANVKVWTREKTGKSATRKLRRQGYIPCVIYGDGEVIHCYTTEREIHKIIYTPEVFLVNLDINDGKRTVQGVIKETQFHPVTDNILHIDFQKVSEDRPIKIHMPVKLVGYAKGVQQGGQLYQLMRYIKVKGLVKDIPDVLEVDVTDLGLGKSLKIADIKFENLKILEPESAVVAVVKLTRAAISRMQEEEKK